MGKNLSFYKGKTLSGNIGKDISFFKDLYKSDSLVRIRKTTIGNSGLDIALIFFDGMASPGFIADHILRSLITATVPENISIDPYYIGKNILYSSEISFCDDISDMLSSVSYGDTVLLTDNSKTAIIINTKGWRFRGITEPINERLTQGPREGFDEAALLNVAQIRRRLITPDLCVLSLTAGRRSDTKVFVCYLESLADKKLVETVKERIKEIDIDGILDSNYIAEEIRDNKLNLFRSIGTTERPDTAVASMLEGRVVIICDGSPVILTVPYLMVENFHSGDDYYKDYVFGSLARLLRFFGFLIASFAPALYVALVTFHAGFLPTFSALSILKLRTGVPVSTLTESIILMVTLELLKEACFRSPKDIGAALSIVGGLVLGEAAVETRTISAPTLIVIALSGLCSALSPKLSRTSFFINIISSVMAGIFGLPGVFTCICITAIYVFSLSSFSVDYTLSLNTVSFQNLKDTLIRTSWKNMINRPSLVKDIRRQKRH